MKVKLAGTFASPAGNFQAGSVVDFPKEEALRLVKTGQAEMVESVEVAIEFPAEKVEKAVAVDVIKRRGRLA